MAYDAAKHKVFSSRLKNFALGYEMAMVEAAKLDQIYIDETDSSNHVNFKNTQHATKNEHKNMIVLMRSFKGFSDGSTDEVQLDRRSILAAFTT